MEDISKYFADDTSVQSSHEEPLQDIKSNSPRFQIVLDDTSGQGNSLLETNSISQSMELDSAQSGRSTTVFRDPAVQKIDFTSSQTGRSHEMLRNIDENRSIGSSGSESEMKTKTPIVKPKASVPIPSARRFMKFSDTPARPRINKKKSTGLPSVLSRFSEIMREDDDDDNDNDDDDNDNGHHDHDKSESGISSESRVSNETYLEKSLYSDNQSVEPNNGETNLSENENDNSSYDENNGNQSIQPSFGQPIFNQDIDEESMPSDYDGSFSHRSEYKYSDESGGGDDGGGGGDFGAENINEDYESFEFSEDNNHSYGDNDNMKNLDIRNPNGDQSTFADSFQQSEEYHIANRKKVTKKSVASPLSPSLSPEPSLIQDESLDVDDEPQTDFDDTMNDNDATYINQSRFDSDDGSDIGEDFTNSSLRGARLGDNSFQITGVRRSKRVKVPPLAYWRNERIVYNLEQEKPHIKEIVYAPPPTKPERKKRRKPIEKASRPSQKRRIEESSDDNDDDSFEEGEVTDKVEGLVFDYPDMNQSSTRVLAWAANAGDFKDVKNAAYSLATLYDYNSVYCAGGIINIRANGSKPLKPSKQNSYIFYVISGKVQVNVSDTVFKLRKGGSFEVPRGNYYSITNIDGEQDARLFFVQATDTLDNEKDS